MQPSLPPGPRAPSVMQTLGWWSRPTAYMERCRAKFGKRFTIQLLGAPPFVMLSDPDDIKEVFQAPPDVLHPGEGARVLEPFVGSHSVILLDEDAHLEQRKLMLPAFHGKKMQELEGLMTEVAEREVESWPRNRPVAIHPLMQKLTLEVILRTVFGLDEGERLDRMRDLTTQLASFGTKLTSLIPELQGKFAPLTGWNEYLKISEESDELLYGVIRERRATGGEERPDVMAMFLAAKHEDGSPMSEKELRDELTTMVVAGHETTATELSWAFEALPRNPAVMQKLQDEIDADESDDYLTATVNETLRRRPVLPNAEPRLTTQPVEIGGHLYPKGVALLAHAYLLHHDPDIYPEPYAFRPERFLNGEKPGNYTFIPFGGGRRRCIGASFATLEMKIVLKAVLQRMQIKTGAEGLELTRRRNITISPRRGTPVVLQDREQQRLRAAA